MAVTQLTSFASTSLSVPNTSQPDGSAASAISARSVHCSFAFVLPIFWTSPARHLPSAHQSACASDASDDSQALEYDGRPFMTSPS
eukprot:7385744-Prymnesium_polylepis.1